MNNSNEIHSVLIYESVEKAKVPTFEPDQDLVQIALQKIQDIFPHSSIYCNKSRPNLKTVAHSYSLVSFLKAVGEKEKDHKDQSVALFYGWYPFLDSELVKEALGCHFRYFADFTYGENIPIGFIPDFCTLELLSQLPDNISDDIRSYVLKHIQDYDIEIFFKNPDLRQFRLDFSTTTHRSSTLAFSVRKHTDDLNYSNLQSFLQSHPEIIRPYPSYFEIELSSQASVAPFYWPEKPANRVPFLDRDKIHKLALDIQQNGMMQDATITLGGLGEPMEHPDFFDILQEFLDLDQVHKIYLETFGIMLDKSAIDRLYKMNGIEKLSIIFRLSTLQKERYQKFYRFDFFDKVQENIQLLENKTSQEYPFRLYIELLRITENDDELKSCLARFEKTDIEVILQKYNSYINLLPERRVANLNPLHRDFCWHLARDFYLTAEGKVPLCKQDPFARKKNSLSFQDHSVREILMKTNPSHSASVRGNHDKIPMPCAECDEWYTFNG